MNPGDGLKLALDHADQLEIDLAAANKRIRRLVEAGDEIAFRLRESVFTEDVVAIEEWDHAKL
jgi:urease accessory protein UreE